MEDKTFNAKNQTLFNINKTNESLNNNINLNSISNIKENEIKNLKISLLNSNTDKNILERNKSNKENENDSLSIKSKKSSKKNNNKIPLKTLQYFKVTHLIFKIIQILIIKNYLVLKNSINQKP